MYSSLLRDHFLGVARSGSLTIGHNESSVPDPSESVVVIDGVKTITLEKLIELKLASGMTAPDRLKDLADVQELIKTKSLDEAFAERLDSFVRGQFLELQRSVQQAASDKLE